jgi:hypothetical protein
MKRQGHLDSLAQAIHRVETIADQTAVHRKKFEFALSQLRRFVQSLSSEDHPTDITGAEVDALSAIKQKLHNLHCLIVENLLQTWSHPTIENPSNYVLDHLRALFADIADLATSIDPQAASHIEPDSAHWARYNMLDLRAIQSSFMQYLRSSDIDQQLSRRIESRLISINRHLAADPANTDFFTTRNFSPIPVTYQSWRVNLSDFEEICQIGGGTSATVHYGRSRLDGGEVAIKKFKFQKLNGSRLQSFQREVACLATAQHPALLKLIGATDQPPFCIITEWMPNGTLYHDLRVHHRLDATGRTIAAFDIARGMQFLHSVHIVHRDMKSLNVLLDSNNRIRICDFGFSRHATEDSLMNQNLGTPHWMAPEVLHKGSHYTSKVDVYAYGVVLWELATGMTPYYGMDSQMIAARVIAEDIRPPMPTDLNPAMRDLIGQCWDRNPDNRPTFDEVVRRFESGQSGFNGASRERFLRYVRESATRGELLTREIERTIKSVVGGELALGDAAAKFRTTGIPPEMLETCWTSLVGVLGQFPAGDVCNFLLLFLKSSRLKDAVGVMKTLGRIPGDVIAALLGEIPTGSEELDNDIVMTACRNSAADLCVVYATSPTNIRLALEVCAHWAVDVQLQAAVVDRCVQCLGGGDDGLAGAALKCLLSLRQLKRVQFARLEVFVDSANETLKSCAFLTVTTLALDGTFPPPEFFEKLLEAMVSDQRAQVAVVAACRSADLALQFVAWLERKAVMVSDGVVRGLVCAARHYALRKRIATLIRKGLGEDIDILNTLQAQLEL